MRILLVLFTLLIIAIVIFVDQGGDIASTIHSTLHEIPLGDKFGHLFFMGTWALLMNLALKARRFQLGPWKPLLGSAIVMVVVTLEEISQYWLPTRNFSWLDLAFDYLGIVGAGFAAVAILNRKAQKDSSPQLPHPPTS
ncbi:MAG: VanZ family protein [Bacteroidota bacterium]